MNENSSEDLIQLLHRYPIEYPFRDRGKALSSTEIKLRGIYPLNDADKKWLCEKFPNALRDDYDLGMIERFLIYVCNILPTETGNLTWTQILSLVKNAKIPVPAPPGFIHLSTMYSRKTNIPAFQLEGLITTKELQDWTEPFGQEGIIKPAQSNDGEAKLSSSDLAKNILSIQRLYENGWSGGNGTTTGDGSK